MISAMWVAKTGLDAQQSRLSVISNNLANANTTAYKKGRAVFEDLLYQTVRQPGSQTSQDTVLPSGLMMGTGVRLVATEKIHTQGNMAQSDSSTSLAIQGKGFFQVLRPNGEMGYTRSGDFQIDPQGRMVTANGYLLQPTITIPEDADSVSIGTDGTVSVQQPGNTNSTQIGAIQLSNFINPAGMQNVGENLYVETTASGGAQTGVPGIGGLGSIYQGALESSNVNSVEELVNMIETQRAYEMNSKSISAADGMLKYLSNNV